jgi:hypothetical protein
VKNLLGCEPSSQVRREQIRNSGAGVSITGAIRALQTNPTRN